MLETRVEELIEDYMEHYEVSFEEAKKLMIEDLEAATPSEDSKEKGDKHAREHRTL